MPKIKINDKELEFTQGQTIIQIAREHGIDIPHFCWHPSLSVSGNCRICLVEIEKMPKLVIACATLAADGMVVKANSEKTLDARRAVMEFLLINHPLDCPICDEAGECKLQDYAYDHSVGESRFKEEKTHKPKRVAVGPNVMLDNERCILCSRCIRFCDEVVKEPQLLFTKRGDRVTLTTYPGKELDNNYAMNTIDLCPVGALTSRDFRFKARVWELSSTKSFCTGCARGCNDEIWVRNNIIMRLTPRFNKEVNNYWMCDHGRLNTFKYVNDETRVSLPQIRKDNVYETVAWPEAYKETLSILKKYSKNQIAFIGSPYATCEDNYIFAKFAKDMGVANLDFQRHFDPEFGDELLRRDDITPNSKGAELAGIRNGVGGFDIEGIINNIKDGKIKVVYLIDDDILSYRPELDEVFNKLDFLIVHASNFNKTSEKANIIFPSSTYAEKNGTMINFEGRIQRLRPAVSVMEKDRSLDLMTVSRMDKFGTDFDRWANKNRKDALSTWKIIANMMNSVGHKYKYDMAENVFNEMVNIIPELDGLDYDIIGDSGINIKSIAEKLHKV